MTGVQSQIKTKPVLPNNVVVTNFTGLELILIYPFRHDLLRHAIGIYLELKMTRIIFLIAILHQIAYSFLVVSNRYNYTSNCTERDKGTTTGFVTFPRLVQPFLEPVKNYTVNINCSDSFNVEIRAQYHFIILGKYWILPLLRLRLNTTQMLYLTLN